VEGPLWNIFGIKIDINN